MDDRFSSVDLTDLIKRLQLCHRSLRAMVEQALSDLEMTDTELLVLGACQRSVSEASAQGAIAVEIGVSPAQLSALVEKLRLRGWLSVERAVGDRRKQLIAPTALGSDRLRQANDRLKAVSLLLAAYLPHTQLHAIVHGLERLAGFCDQAPSISVGASVELRLGEAA